MALRRIAQEHADLQRDPLETCSASPAGTDNPLQWIGYITGPPDTPYEQKRFSIAIAFSEDDPMKPFRLTFTTPLSHPNISDEGEVWLAELEEKHWSPVLTVRSILLCLQVLLSNPKPYQHVMNSKAARVHLKNNPQEHDGGSNAAGGGHTVYYSRPCRTYSLRQADQRQEIRHGCKSP
ncbi:hypothetical protein J1614_000846 [Plenodomus biglobosus]|nr:hypothetical protein J1614_000846 [Plenodomus biglobosus]